MSTRIGLRKPALAVALLLGMGSRATAAPRPQAWILSVIDGATREADTSLATMLREAVRLRSGLGLRWGPPPRGACERACAEIQIVGTRTGAPRYRIRVRWLPGKRTDTVEFAAPAGTDLWALAEALVLKCLGALEATARPARRARAVPSNAAGRRPPRAGARRHAPWRGRFALGAGPALLLGLGRSFFTFGVDASLSAQLIGPVAVRLSVGYQDLGRGNGGVRLQYRAIPAFLGAGGRWTLSRFTLEAYGGVALLAVWLHFDAVAPSDESDVAVGAAVALRATVRLHTRVGLGLSLRPIYMTDDMSVQENQGTTLFRLPGFLLLVGLDFHGVF